MRWLSVVAAAALCAACGQGSATNAANGQAESATVTAAGASAAAGAAAAATPPAPVTREVIIPEGTTLQLDLTSAVGSDTSRVEEAVEATLRQPVVVKGETILPTGTELTGAVTDVEDSGRVKGRARVAFRFTSLRVGGERYAIRTAVIAQQAAATKGEDAKKIAIGAGAGAALGAVLGGGSGAAKGAAIGGAGGTGVVLATKGKEVRLGPGANLTTRLAAPVTVRVKS